MKKGINVFIGIVLLTLLSFSWIADKTKDIAIGSKLPSANMEMQNIDERKLTLQSVARPNGLVVVFSCNTCPFVLGWEDRYNDISALCNSQNIGFVAINSNEAKRNGADSLEEMIKHAKEKDYSFPYLLDKDSELAKSFGATVTPQVYFFDNDLKLVYKGLIDDNMRDKASATPHLVNAINAISKDEKVDPSETKAQGCSIKKMKKKS